MTEQKLLTEAEWRSILRQSVNHDVANSIICDLRERGMIAPEPEPVDPLLEEAREIAASYYEDNGIRYLAREIRKGYQDHGVGVCIALAALRRNLELAERPTLTREMVQDVVDSASRLTPMRETFVDCVYALLVERLK